MSEESVPARARRHPVWVMAEARRLSDADWAPRGIVDILLKEHGITVTYDTVCRWTNAAYAARSADRITRRNRRVWSQRWTFQLGGVRPSTEYQAAFVRRLRDENVTWANVARVCRIVFGGRWTIDRVKKLEELAA